MDALLILGESQNTIDIEQIYLGKIIKAVAIRGINYLKDWAELEAVAKSSLYNTEI